MKLFLLLVLTVLAGCGDDSESFSQPHTTPEPTPVPAGPCGASKLLGSWQTPEGREVTFDSDCHVASSCGWITTYAVDQSTFKLEIQNNNMPPFGCLPSGTYTCTPTRYFSGFTEKVDLNCK